jgi:TRAP-type C4-dicarboxylate transport system permease small subunit
MAGTVKLVGTGLLVLIALAVLIWAASAYVSIDSLRRRRTDYAGVPEGRWFYAVPQVLFFFVFFAWQVPFVQQKVPWIGTLVLAVPLVLAQQMAYLLRVVFPTAKRLEKRLEAEREAGLLEPPDEPLDEPEPEADGTEDDEGFFDDSDD